MNRCETSVGSVLGVLSASGLSCLAVSCAPCSWPLIPDSVSWQCDLSAPRNEAPILLFVKPDADTSVVQGTDFVIQWEDMDRDSNASIRLDFINVATAAVVVLADGIDENDRDAPDTLSVDTSSIPVGEYNLRSRIDDRVNPSVTLHATTVDETGPVRNIVITVLEPDANE